MAKKNLVYRPPSSDSDSDYDGFYFGDGIKKNRTHFVPVAKSLHRQLIDAVRDGDLILLKNKLENSAIKVDDYLEDGSTLLLHSCRASQPDIVEYLLKEKHANANQEYDSVTPIMAACDFITNKSDNVVKIISLLMEHNAVVNETDKFGKTALMFACRNGHTAAVPQLLPKSSLNAKDNMGCTAIFHATENNHQDIVRELIKAGADTTIANYKGDTPLIVAEFHGFQELLDILPKENLIETYFVPTEFFGYNTLRDHIPRIFLKSECPEYFQEIAKILLSNNLENFTEHFAKGRVSFAEFLTISDEKLDELGIVLPIHKSKIKMALLDYHLHHWSVNTIETVTETSQENFYGILLLAANQLQQLVAISSSLRFIRNNLEHGMCGSLKAQTLKEIEDNLHHYRRTVRDIRMTVKYLSAFSPPKNLLHIDYDEYLAERKRRQLQRYFKYTTIILGLTVFVCLKVKRVF